MVPFKYGQVVMGSDFCDRGKIFDDVLEHLKSGQNIALLGERRVGKTSIICEAARQMKKQVLYCDFWAVKTVEDVCKRMIKGVLEIETSEAWYIKILKQLSSLRPVFSIDPITHMPELTFEDQQKAKSPQSVSEALRFVRDIVKDKKAIVVLDEFQGILSIKESQEVIALMRSDIQFHKQTPYVFAGSIRHKLERVFSDPDSPMYNLAKRMTVHNIPRDSFKAFLSKKFKKGGRTVEDEVFDKIFELTAEIPGDVQCMCEALWSVSDQGDVIDEEKFRLALLLIFAREKATYDDKVLNLTNYQTRCLKTVAVLGGEKVFSNEFIRRSGLPTPAAVQRSLEKLLVTNILFESNGEYRFFDPFFRAWLIHSGAL